MTSPDEPTTPDDALPVEPRPGEVERVPLKVVPIFVQPIEEEPPAEEPEEVIEADPAPKRRPLAFVIAAVILALGTVGVHIAAIVVATAGDFPLGTWLGYVAVGVSALAAIVAVVALVVGRARWWAAGALLVAVLANPLVLLTVLRALSGLQTT